MRDIYDLFNLIGKNLKNIRKDIIKSSQEKLAEDINMSRSFLSQIESENVKVGISLDTLFLIAQTYNLDMRIFFDGYESLMDNIPEKEIK